MDGEYYYYCFDESNLINCTNTDGGNKNGKKII